MAQSSTSSGSAAVATTGYTVAKLLTKIADMAGLTEGTAADALKIYQAITYCGRAASTWRGESWWWLQDGTGNFAQVSGTGSYTLRTVNSSDMSDLMRVTRVYYDDDWSLKPITWRRYRMDQATALNDTNSRPTAYTVIGTSPKIYLLPEPNTTDTIYVDYLKVHNAISIGTDSSLIVPEEYQEGIYVDGPLWVLRKEISSGESLEQCRGFMEAINRMAQSSAMSYDSDPANEFEEVGGNLRWPQDQKVLGDGSIILNEMSV